MANTASSPTRSATAGRAGVLLVNLGTPDAPRTPEVRRYLREFLSDPRVIDMNPVGRAALLNLVILPFRPRKSAAAYAKIWTDRGSPLLVFGEALLEGVRERLGSEAPAELAMRYGRPSIAAGLRALKDRGVDRVVVMPLYPQSASATTGSTLEAVYREAGRFWNVPDLCSVPAFYDHPGFIGAFAEVGRPVLESLQPDRVLFSYHGLPERQVIRSDESGRRCLRSDTCCDTMDAVNRNCYRAQCFATSRLLAGALGLESGSWTVTFQSRLGRVPWIKPYTDLVLADLPRQGVKRVAVFSPAFVADCLETLEEIAIRGRETFLAAGGEELRLVPSLNDHPGWMDTAVELVRARLG
jgi:ferrochelatase